MSTAPTVEDHCSDVIDTMLMGVGYWADTYGTPDSLTVLERESPHNESGITPESLAAWLQTDGPRALIRQIDNEYHSNALRAMILGDWDDIDYDADTADLIAQQIVLGEVVYG